MTEQNTYLNAKEFSEAAGIPSSTLTRLLRDGKIKGLKKSGKWAIPKSELTSSAILEISGEKPAKRETASSETPAKKAASSKTYSVSEFSKMTYLTEKGVMNWLNKGRLKGSKTSPGEWQVDAGNLEHPDVERLIRKN